MSLSSSSLPMSRNSARPDGRRIHVFGINRALPRTPKREARKTRGASRFVGLQDLSARARLARRLHRVNRADRNDVPARYGFAKPRPGGHKFATLRLRIAPPIGPLG